MLHSWNIPIWIFPYWDIDTLVSDRYDATMEVTFSDDRLDRLETDASYAMGLSAAVVRAYRKRILMIRSATDERDFYAMKSLHFEKLLGKRQHQRSMRVNEQYRLIMEVREAKGGKEVRIVSLEDYH